MCWKTSILGLAFATTLSACQTPTKPSQERPKGPQTSSWRAQMQQMSAHLQALTPFIFSKNNFTPKTPPAEKNAIARNLSEFSRLLSQFKQLPAAQFPEKDPALIATFERLHSDVQIAEESFRSQNHALAQMQLKGVVQYCSFCHTRRSTGASLDFSIAPHALAGATPLEKSDFFVATRQFQRAKDVLSQALFADPSRGDDSLPHTAEDSPHQSKHPIHFSHPFAREQALKRLLMIEIRFQASPRGALQALSQYRMGPRPTESMQRLISNWSKDLHTWQRQKGRLPESLEQVEALLQQAEAKKEYFYDEGAQVSYLLASRGLHDLLSRPQTPPQRAQTYHLLGRSYEVLRGLGLWNLNEIYYDACIRTQPHTQRARLCYKDLDNSIRSGFSGSGGSFIPHSFRKYLERMKRLSQRPPTQSQ